MTLTLWLPSTLHEKNAEPPKDTDTSLGSSLNLNSSKITDVTTKLWGYWRFLHIYIFKPTNKILNIMMGTKIPIYKSNFECKYINYFSDHKPINTIKNMFDLNKLIFFYVIIKLIIFENIYWIIVISIDMSQ